MRHLQIYILVLLAQIFSFPAWSTIQLLEDVRLSGFASTSITKSDNERPLLLSREVTDATCYDCDTTFGLQLDWSMTDDFNASIQIVKRPQDNWSNPELEWAYVGYTYQDINIKAGRLRLPLLLSSEYHYVGQAYTWARPPSTVYDSILGFTSYDGFNFSWYKELSDDLSLTLTPYYGFSKKTDLDYGNLNFDFKTDQSFGLSAELSHFNFRIHAAYMKSYYDLNLLIKALPNIPAGVMPTLPDGNPSRLKDQTLAIYTLGVEYNYEQFTFTTEMLDDDLQTNWYVSTAYNLGRFTPYVVYGEGHGWRKSESVTAGLRFALTSTISVNTEWFYTQAIKGTNGHFIPSSIDDSNNANLYTMMFNIIF